MLPLCQGFPVSSATKSFVTLCQISSSYSTSVTPATQRLLALTRDWFGPALPSAHHYSGNRGCFLFLRTQMFISRDHSTCPERVPGRGDGIMPMSISYLHTSNSMSGCRLPWAYRSAPTSFFMFSGAKASTCAPLTGDHRSCLSVHCAVLKIRAVPVRTSASAAGDPVPKGMASRAGSLRAGYRRRRDRHRHHPLPSGDQLA